VAFWDFWGFFALIPMLSFYFNDIFSRKGNKGSKSQKPTLLSID